MTRLTLVLPLAAAFILSAQTPVSSAAQTPPAGADAALYQAFCGTCHDSGFGGRAPKRDVLATMSADRVLAAMNTGIMMAQSGLLSNPQRALVAEFVTGKKLGAGIPDEPAKESFCAGAPGTFPADPWKDPHWNGWGLSPDNKRFQPASMAKLDAAQVPKLKLKWAFGYPGDLMAYGQPTVVGGRIFVGSAGRKVYALDAKFGCTYWYFRTDGFVRAAITVEDGLAFVGDGKGFIYALSAATGKQVWKTQVDSHPEVRITGALKYHEGKLYVPVSSFEEGTGANPMYNCCTFRGSVVSLDSATGKQLWKTYTITEEAKPTKKNAAGTQLYGPAGAAVWSSPTIDAKSGVLYVATGDNYSEPDSDMSDAIIAMNLKTGAIVWHRQMTKGDIWNLACGVGLKSIGVAEINCPNADAPDADFGSSPILLTLPGGRRALVVGQKSGNVYALDPDKKGATIWETKLGRGGRAGGIQWGPASDGQRLYAAVSDVQFGFAADAKAGMAVKIDPKIGGGLFALSIKDGEKVWYAKPGECGDRSPCSPAQSAAVTVIPGVVFSGSVDGHFRAYSTKDGKVLWDFDTFREFDAVNKVPARGGSIDGPGATVVDGIVYVNSGYAFIGGQAGNVLLAFSVDGK